MKRLHSSIGVAIILLFVFSIGCATFESNAYKTLTISKTTYDTAMKLSAELYSKGQMSEAQKGEVIRLGKIYKGAHNTAVASFLEFKQSSTNAAEMTYIAQFSAAAAALVDLLDYVYTLQGGK